MDVVFAIAWMFVVNFPLYIIAVRLGYKWFLVPLIQSASAGNDFIAVAYVIGCSLLFGLFHDSDRRDNENRSAVNEVMSVTIKLAVTIVAMWLTQLFT